MVDGGGHEIRRAPRLGEHTEHVLESRLGLNPTEIEELHERSVI